MNNHETEPREPHQEVEPTTAANGRLGSLARTVPRKYALAAIPLGVALMAAVVWGHTTAESLNATRASLAQAQDTISTQVGEISGLEADVARERLIGADLEGQVATLEERIEYQTQCITVLSDAVATLEEVHASEVIINNLMAEGSAWAAARTDYTNAMQSIADAYYEAYSAAWDGLYASANNWVAEGNSQATEADGHIVRMNAEIDAVNALIEEVERTLDGYESIDWSPCTSDSSSAGQPVGDS